MPKIIKKTVIKEPVRLRIKPIANGCGSLYLDIYRHGKRSYEFLKIYLIPERTSGDRQSNERKLAAANAIKTQRILDLAYESADMPIGDGGVVSLHDWIEIFMKKKSEKSTISTYNSRRAAFRLLEEFGDNLPISQVNVSYCTRYSRFLSRHHKTVAKKGVGRIDTDELLSETSVRKYFLVFAEAMASAVKAGLIKSNPVDRMDTDDKPKIRSETSRTFLTVDEVKALMDTLCKRRDVKDAFLFACHCGLRWSDVSTITWSMLEVNNGQTYLNMTMYKTKRGLYLPLNNSSLKYIPERGDAPSSGRIFSTLPSISTVDSILNDWGKDAGLAKHISFHVSRHTFATMSLTAGADLYTTSKLLGHTNINTTQIYARIVNSKKAEAVSLLDKMFED